MAAPPFLSTPGDSDDRKRRQPEAEGESFSEDAEEGQDEARPRKRARSLEH